MADSYEIVRNAAGLCDLGAEGRMKIVGTDAIDGVNALFSMDLETALPGGGLSGMFLDESAKIIAFATIFIDDEDLFLITEPSTADVLMTYLSDKLANRDAKIQDLSSTHDWISILGPKAQEIMIEVGGDDILGLPYLSFEHNQDLDLKVFRMGGCGEFEYRLLCPKDRTETIISELLRRGESFGLALIEASVMPLLELEMRTLRLADIPEGVTPIDCGLHWMIDFRKETFPGSDVIHAAKEKPAHRMVMLSFPKGSHAEAGGRITIEGQDMGYLVRVIHSPALDQTVGLALADPDFGWIGVSFETNDDGSLGTATSAPLFITKTVMEA